MRQTSNWYWKALTVGHHSEVHCEMRLIIIWYFFVIFAFLKKIVFFSHVNKSLIVPLETQGQIFFLKFVFIHCRVHKTRKIMYLKNFQICMLNTFSHIENWVFEFWWLNEINHLQIYFTACQHPKILFFSRENH